MSYRSYVAPRVGAWIETYQVQQGRRRRQSHPVWVRGLKHLLACYYRRRYCVAPRVGAWIETRRSG